MRGDAQLLELASRDQRGVPRLRIPGAREDLAHRVQPAVDARRGGCPPLVTPARQRGRHTVVSVDAAYLLDQVFWNRDVEPEDRRQHVPLTIASDLDVEVEAPEDRLGFLERNMRAED